MTKLDFKHFSKYTGIRRQQKETATPSRSSRT